MHLLYTQRENMMIKSVQFVRYYKKLLYDYGGVFFKFPSLQRVYEKIVLVTYKC